MNDRKLMADVVYYRKVYMGTLDVDDREITRLLRRAYDNISASTLGRSLSSLPEHEVDMVKRAACYEADAIYELEQIGGVSGAGMLGSWSMDGVSVNYKDMIQNNPAIKNGGVIDKTALGILNNTSLRDRVVY